jgi:hypothetical protein
MSHRKDTIQNPVRQQVSHLNMWWWGIKVANQVYIHEEVTRSKSDNAVGYCWSKSVSL